MPVKTTINMHRHILKKIEDASMLTQMSGSEIINMLLMKVMSEDKNKAKLGEPVKYQKSDEQNMWHKFHIRFGDVEYEYYLDLRRLLKMSRSLLIAYAVKKYLNDIINGESNDNYKFQNYILVEEEVKGVICWKLFWGFPKNFEKYINFSPL